MNNLNWSDKYHWIDEDKAQNLGLHWDEKDFPEGEHGAAIVQCLEMEDGTLWVTNAEYASQVNYCPFCGYRARVPAKEGSKWQ